MDYSAEAYNCIIYGNAFSDGLTTYNGYSADVDEGAGEGSSVYNCIISNPLFGAGYRLAAGSPCIDAGDNSYVTSDKDLAANARIVNGTVDIGCYEYGSSPVGGSLADGLVAYYPFDGNANDASGNGNHGTTHGVTLTMDRFGNANRAYYFGDGNYISVPDSCSLNSPDAEITIAVWARIDEWYITNDSWAPILLKGDRQYSFNLLGHAGVASTQIGYYMDARFKTLPSLGKWCHLVVTYVNECAYAYLNGNLVGTNECSGDFTPNSTELQIGRDYEGLDEYLYGALDDLRIYNRALSAAEVKALYDGTGVTPPTYYTVTFNANGGSVSPTTRSVASGAAVGTLPTPTRSGYTFAGWWTAASGGSQVSASTKVYGNKTYYAHWTKINSVRLTVKPNSTKYGTASGGGKYGVGTKATLKAKAKKGYAFAGWFKDKSCKTALNPKGYDNRNPTVKYTVPAGDTTVYAKFISKAKAKKSLKFSSATKKLAKTPKKVQSGKSLSLSLGISSATITKVTAKGLPKGLSINKTTGKISGTPTKAGTYTVTITVKDAAGNKITQKIKIKVVAPKMPSKIVGTYYGYTGNWNSEDKKVQMDGHSREVTLTVSSSGKVSAKVGSSSFSGARLSLNNGSYYFYGKCKATGETLDVVINPKASWKDDSLTGYLWTSSGKKKYVRARKNAAATNSKAKKMAAKCAKIGTQTIGVSVNDNPKIYGDYDYHLVCPRCADHDWFLGLEKVYVKTDKDGKATLSGTIAGKRVSGSAYLQYHIENTSDWNVAHAYFFSGNFVIEVEYLGTPEPIDGGSTGGTIWKKK